MEQSHICVLQTALDLLERGYDVHVLADGVSSCNKEEVPVALSRMQQAGAQVTTSESILYQLMGESSCDLHVSCSTPRRAAHSGACGLYELCHGGAVDSVRFRALRYGPESTL